MGPMSGVHATTTSVSVCEFCNREHDQRAAPVKEKEAEKSACDAMATQLASGSNGQGRKRKEQAGEQREQVHQEEVARREKEEKATSSGSKTLTPDKVARRLREEVNRVLKIPPHKAKSPFQTTNANEALAAKIHEATEEQIIKVLTDTSRRELWRALLGRDGLGLGAQ